MKLKLLALVSFLVMGISTPAQAQARVILDVEFGSGKEKVNVLVPSRRYRRVYRRPHSRSRYYRSGSHSNRRSHRVYSPYRRSTRRSRGTSSKAHYHSFPRNPHRSHYRYSW
ncbi:MAG: hypothetical protein ACFBSC_19435 [Microcoleaceae cyanobacterium]